MEECNKSNRTLKDDLETNQVNDAVSLTPKKREDFLEKSVNSDEKPIKTRFHRKSAVDNLNQTITEKDECLDEPNTDYHVGNPYSRIENSEERQICKTKSTKNETKNGKVKRTLPKEKNILCHICGDIFRRQHQLNVHMRKHRGEKPYQCHHCKAQFHQRSTWQSHLTFHSRERPSQCPHCPKAFTNSTILSAHVRTKHSSAKPFPCRFCKEAFAFNSQRYKHMANKHHGHVEKRSRTVAYPCPICGKKFFLKERLETHTLKMHSVTEGIHSCPICQKVCKTRKSLVQHMHIHSEKPPLECSQCRAKLKTSASLKRHQRERHQPDGTPGSICYECGKTFKGKSYLYIHLKLHNPQDSFRCPHCSKPFTQKKYLQAHVACKHAGAQEVNRTELLPADGFPEPEIMYYPAMY